MITKINSVIVILVFFFSIQEGQSQDPIFTQFYNAPIELNPAFAGISYAPSFALNYRNQWPAISNVYQTYAASYDQFSERLNSGFGLSLLTDSAGDGALKTFKLAGQYAYRIPVVVDKVYIKIGLEAGLIQSRVDWQKLTFPDQIDPEFGAISPGGTPYPTGEGQPDNLSKSILDASTGLVLYSQEFYVGLAAKHINGAKNNFLPNNLADGLPLRVSLHAGYQFDIKKSNKRRAGTFISPNVLFVKQADFAQLLGGAYIGFNDFFVGSWYRHAWGNPDAAILSFGLKTGMYKFSYSYDLTISALSWDTGGSHELGININLEEIYPKRSQLNDCVKLFR